VGTVLSVHPLVAITTSKGTAADSLDSITEASATPIVRASLYAGNPSVTSGSFFVTLARSESIEPMLRGEGVELEFLAISRRVSC
jgi:hypothetical protein